jgi:sulfite reductase alpha subunit-like flavoprotein
MKQAVEAGYWTLYRYNPDLILKGENPFKLDSKRISRAVDEFTSLENRFMTLERSNPTIAAALKEQLQDFADRKHTNYKKLAAGEETEAVGTPLTILVGSDTGTAIELSARMKKQCESRNYTVTVLELDEITSIEDLAAMENVMLLCSTAGEGDMPGNATNFWAMFEEGDFDSDVLQNMKLHTFGLGDRGYRHFNLAAKLIDEKFVELGATRMQDVGLGDDQDDDKYETALEEWMPDFWKIQNAPEPADAHLIAEPTVELVPQPAEKWTYRQIMPPGTKMLNLEENKRITPVEHDRIIRHLTFDVTGKDFSYLLGDALNIFPQNDPDRIRAFLTGYGLDPDAVYQVDLKEGADKRRKAAYRRPLSVQQIFTEVVDIEGRPNKFFYKELAKFAVDPEEKAKLELACSDSEEGKKLYGEFVTETVTYVDVLNQFPSAHPPLEHLMSMIPCIKPRLYSIASSQRYVNDKVELMIVINDWDTPGGKYRIGLCTDYVERMSTDGKDIAFDVPCSVTTGTFNFPESFMQPMVMAGLGTGLAPFRAFIQERAHFKRLGHEGGPMWLFYGCRHKARDYCFGDELQAYLEEGVITELRPAFSRDQKEKIYVQHKIIEVADRLYEEFEKKNGYFYLCGQAGAVETDIENAIKDGMVKGGGLSPEEAAAKVEAMHDEGRYNLELY